MKLHATKIKNLAYSLSAKGKKTYYARYRIDGVKKIHRLGLNFTEAKKQLREIVDGLALENSLPQGLALDDVVDALKDKIDETFVITKKLGITYKELFYDYVETETQEQSEKELSGKIAKHENFIFDCLVSDDVNFGDLDLMDIRYSHCQKVINMLLDNEVKPKTALNYKTAMSVVFKFGIVEGYIKENFAEYIKVPTFDNRRKFILNQNKVKSLFRAINTTRDEVFRLIFLFGFHGRRLNEILSLEIDQIDLDNKIYTIDPEKNKSRKWFTHEMTPLLFDELKAYIHRYSPEKYLFVNPNTNNPYTDIRGNFKDLKKRAGITEQFDFHMFRHMIATIAVNDLDMTLEKVQSTLQHSDIQTTQIYRNHHPKTSREVNEAIIAYAS